VPSAALLLATGLCLPAFAFQPLITDDTGTQRAGGNQLELSLNRERVEAAGLVDRVSTLPVVYTRGLSDALDVFVGLSHARVRPSATAGDANGNGNPVMGAKWRFYENERSGYSLALKPEILFPVSAGRESAGLGTGRHSGGVTLIFTQEAAFGAVHVNAGAGRERFRDAAINPDTRTTRVSLAPVWDVNAQWKLALDLGSESAHAADASVRSNFLELGAIWAPSKDLDLALGVVRARDDNSPAATTHNVTAGITWRFR